MVPAQRRPARSPKSAQRAVAIRIVERAAGGDMRRASVALTLMIAAALPAKASVTASGKHAFITRGEVVEWMDHYRERPDPSRLPEAVKALSEAGAFREPEGAGYYVGFVAGVLGTNP